jgi:Mrp family chromosome partitioning ATPase
VEPIEFLRILRRRWRVLAACVLVGVCAAVLVNPAAAKSSPAHRQYKASAVLVENTVKSAARENLSQDAFLLTVGVVPERVAMLVHYPGNPAGLVTHMKSTVDTKISTITILVTMPTAAKATAIANAFAEQLVGYLRDVSGGALDLRVAGLLQNQTTLTQALKPILARIDALKKVGQVDQILESKRQSLLAQFNSVLNQYEGLLNGSVDTGRYRVIEAKLAAALPSGGGSLSKLASRKTRALLALGLGLLLGAMLALVLDKFDLSVRTKRDAEEAFGLPVVSEIPALRPATRRRGEVVTVARPISPYAEVHRILRHSVLFAQLTPWPTAENGNGHANGNGDAVVRAAIGKRRQVVIVTSAGSAEGKTTTVANLAASFAESGQSVLVLSCDFHGHRIQKMLGVADGQGIATVLRGGPGAPTLADVTVETTIPGVWLAPSGEALDTPPELASSVGALIAAARDLADMVIIDTPALLSVSAASEVLPAADIALVVARSARTTREAAWRTQERLERLGAPVLGVVLVGPQIPSVSREYSRPPGGWRKRRKLLRARDVQIGVRRATKLERTEEEDPKPAVPEARRKREGTVRGTDVAKDGGVSDDPSPRPRWRRREARRDE